MFVLGVDIGYSALKVAMGRQGEPPREIALPAGAAPRERLGIAVSARGLEERAESGAIEVRLDGEPWIAGVHPGRFERWSRPLHEDYAATRPYRALLYAALTAAASERIDALVTGLPTRLWLDPERRAALACAIEGVHWPDGAREVEVASVTVLPQPLGAFVDFLLRHPDTRLLERLGETRALVVDVGHYSTDWAVIDSGRLQRAVVGTSTRAMSMVLERTAELIHADGLGQVAPHLLEEALRAGRRTVLGRHMRALDIGNYLERAGAEIAPLALDALRADLRAADGGPGVVVLTGGGAPTLEPWLREAFPEALVLAGGEDRLGANARGFFYSRALP